MREVDDALKADLIDVVTTLATCWRITRNDGQIVGFTDHDAPLYFDGVTYEPSGVSPTETSNSMKMSVDSVELHGLIEQGSDTPKQIVAKLYDRAQVDVFSVNYKRPPVTVTERSVLWVKSGIVGDIVRERGRWVVENRSLLDLLKQANAPKTSRLCRAEFGDSACKADLSLYQHTGTVTEVSGSSVTVDVAGLPSSVMEQGKMTVNSAGVSFDVSSNSGSRLVLTEAPEFDLVGETVTLTQGCNKWLTDCEKYDNVNNYQGEPHIPDADEWIAGYFKTVSV